MTLLTAQRLLREARIMARDLDRRDPKKFYVVIPFSDDYAKRQLVDLSRGVLDGVQGISEKSEIIMQWYGVARDAVLVMDGKELAKLNSLSRVQYDNPEYLVSRGMAALHRVWDKKMGEDGAYGVAGNLVDALVAASALKSLRGQKILDEANALAGRIDAAAEKVQSALAALSFDGDERRAVESVTNRQLDDDDFRAFIKESNKVAEDLRNVASWYEGLSKRIVNLYLDDERASVRSSYRDAAALAPRVEAEALDYGWTADQAASLRDLMAAFAVLVDERLKIEGLKKRALAELELLSQMGGVRYALDRGSYRHELQKDFRDHGTDDIKTVKGLAKRLHQVAKRVRDTEDIPLPIWEVLTRRALKTVGHTYADEGEWLVKDRKLKIPKKSALYITASPLPPDLEKKRKAGTLTDLEGFVHRSHIEKAGQLDRLIEEYKLDDRYRVFRLSPEKLDKAKKLYWNRPKPPLAIDAAFFDPTKPLKPMNVLTVYHGTHLEQVAHLLNGFDATSEHVRMYGGPRHRGIFVAPTPEVARKFGDVVIEIEVRAKNLHGTDYSGRTGRLHPDREKAWKDKHPTSFRPYLSQTLSQSNEPQALLVGLVSPKMTKRVLYKGQWYSRQEFLNLRVETTPAPKPGRSFVEQEINDIGVDVASTRITFNDFLAAVAKTADVDVSKAREVLTRRAAIPVTNDRDALLELLERVFEPTAARAHAKRFRSRLQAGSVNAAFAIPLRDPRRSLLLMQNAAQTLAKSIAAWTPALESEAGPPPALRKRAVDLVAWLEPVIAELERKSANPYGPAAIAKAAALREVLTPDKLGMIEALVKAVLLNLKPLKEELDAFDASDLLSKGYISELEAKFISSFIERLPLIVERLDFDRFKKQLADLQKYVPFDDESLPAGAEKEEALYHASINAADIAKTGFAARPPLDGGLGGSQSDKAGNPAISFTYDLHAAKEIARSLKEAVEIARGQYTRAKLLRLLEDEDAGALRQAMKEMKDKGQDDPEHLFMLYSYFVAYAFKRFDPRYFGNRKKMAQAFAKADPRKVGVIEARVDVTHPDIKHLSGERELRVPPSAVVRIVRVIR